MTVSRLRELERLASLRAARYPHEPFFQDTAHLRVSLQSIHPCNTGAAAHRTRTPFCLGNMTLDAYMLTLAHQSEMNEAQAAQAELRATIWRFHERSGRTEIRHHVELWNTHAERHVATLPHLVV